MTVLEIVEKYLRDNGYDGLCSDDCGCDLEDLASCGGESLANCEPGYKSPCPGPEDCEHFDPAIPHDHIGAEKPKEKP